MYVANIFHRQRDAATFWAW